MRMGLSIGIFPFSIVPYEFCPKFSLITNYIRHTFRELHSILRPIGWTVRPRPLGGVTPSPGVCLGLRFPNITGHDLSDILRSLPSNCFPADVRSECFESIDEHEKPCVGDWVAIWGGSSTSALFLSQIASLAGLKIILVVDVARHGERLANSECVLVDCHDPARAVETIRGITQGSLRFGIDTVGKETATHLAHCLEANPEKRAHLVGLAALPKAEVPSVVYHSVPMKIFHEVPEIGESLMLWLGIALEKSLLSLPIVSTMTGGLSGINAALGQMRRGEVSGRRLVVPI